MECKYITYKCRRRIWFLLPSMIWFFLLNSRTRFIGQGLTAAGIIHKSQMNYFVLVLLTLYCTLSDSVDVRMFLLSEFNQTLKTRSGSAEYSDALCLSSILQHINTHSWETEETRGEFAFHFLQRTRDPTERAELGGGNPRARRGPRFKARAERVCAGLTASVKASLFCSSWASRSFCRGQKKKM